MKCPFCHEEYDDDMEYCPHCGSDNPNVDQREIREEKAKINSAPSFSTPIALNNSEEDENLKWSDDATMEFDTDDGIYTVCFDLSDEKEKAAYDELQKLQDTKLGNGILSFLFTMLVAVIVFAVVYMKAATSVIGLVVTILIGLALFAVGVAILSKRDDSAKIISEKQCEYFKYKIEKDGAEILKYDGEKRNVVYKLNGEVKTVHFSYYIPAGKGRGHWY